MSPTSEQHTCHIELCEGVASGRPDSCEQIGGLICQVTAVTEVESRQEGHVANDEAKCGICDVKACQPEVGHVPELATIVLTCTGKQRAYINTLNSSPALKLQEASATCWPSPLQGV